MLTWVRSYNKLFTNWAFVPYLEIQVLDFPYSPHKLGLYETSDLYFLAKYDPRIQLVDSKYTNDHRLWYIMVYLVTYQISDVLGLLRTVQ